MSDEVITQLYLVVSAGTVGVAHWRTWWGSVPGFLAGNMSRASCLMRVAGWQLLALVAPIGALLLLVGIEEATKIPLVPERIILITGALTFLQLVAGITTFIAAIGRTRPAGQSTRTP